MDANSISPESAAVVAEEPRPALLGLSFVAMARNPAAVSRQKPWISAWSGRRSPSGDATLPATDSPLFGLPNVVVTPHLGASTTEAQDRAGAAFTATGTTCGAVRWSEQALSAYPRIASACPTLAVAPAKT